MASPSRTRAPLRLMKRRRAQPAGRRCASDWSHVQTSLPRRTISPIFATLSPDPSYRLATTLADLVPTAHPPLALPSAHDGHELPPAHHLLYFEPAKRASEMLRDGTNPDHSPGEPFVRRMWAGGQVLFNTGHPLVLDGSVAVCAEFIKNVAVKGRPGDERAFVEIERRIARATEHESAALSAASRDPDARHDLHHRVRQRLWRHAPDDFGPASIVETRTLVFMRAPPPEPPAAAAAAAAAKILRPPHPTPDYTHALRVDPALLFRYSALTFNAHAIHLDPLHARRVEGHPTTLVHGPLSFTILAHLLHQRLAAHATQVIRAVEYRNTAPLYCGEQVTFCGVRTGARKWDVWAQGPHGGVAVKGRVVTEDARRVARRQMMT